MTGFIPVKRGTATPYTGGVNRYFVSGSESNAMFVGDPVELDATNTETAGKYPSVTIATAAADNPVVGVIVAFEPVSEELKTSNPLETVHRPASTAAYVLVADDPYQEFIVGEDEGGAAIVTGDIGNLGIAVTGSGGSTVYGNSSWVLDSSSFNSGTANGQYLLLGMVDRADFELGGDGQMFRVRINPAQHQLATHATAIS